MLVAVAIVGLLVGLVAPAAMGQLQSSRIKTTEAQISQIRTAIDIFVIDTGRPPTEAEGRIAMRLIADLEMRYHMAVEARRKFMAP